MQIFLTLDKPLVRLHMTAALKIDVLADLSKHGLFDAREFAAKLLNRIRQVEDELASLLRRHALAEASVGVWLLLCHSRVAEASTVLLVAHAEAKDLPVLLFD